MILVISPVKNNRTLNPWLLVALLWVVALLNYLDRQVIFSLFPLLAKDLQIGDVELGLTSTVFLWVYGLLSPFAGYLADRFGRVRIILVSLLVWSAVTWLTAHAANIQQMLLARALMGISEACYIPAGLALVAEAHGERTRSLATGFHQSGLYTGIVLGGVGGGWMGQQFGWRPVFTILGVVGIVYALVLALALRRAPQPAAAAGQPPRFWSSLGTLFRLPGFRAVLAAFSLFSIAQWLVYTWLPLYLYQKFNLSLANAGFSATFYIQAASYTGVILGGLFADRWSGKSPRARVFTQAAGLALGAPFLVLIGLTSNYVLLIVALVTYGLGRGFYDANTMPVLSQIASPEMRATGYGLMNMTGCVLGGVSAAGAGWLKQNIGLGAAFEIAGVVLFLAAWMSLTVRLSPAPAARPTHAA